MTLGRFQEVLEVFGFSSSFWGNLEKRFGMFDSQILRIGGLLVFSSMSFFAAPWDTLEVHRCRWGEPLSSPHVHLMTEVPGVAQLHSWPRTPCKSTQRHRVDTELTLSWH